MNRIASDLRRSAAILGREVFVGRNKPQAPFRR